MHTLLEKELVSEECGQQSVSYVLKDENLFNLSEYKILHNQEASFFVDSAKLTFNGKVKLTYFVDGLISFKSISSTLDAFQFVTVLANLISSVIEIKHNGYLDVCDLNLEFNRIYVNPNTLGVKLIYLPLNDNLPLGTVVLNNPEIEELRMNLIKLISTNPNLISGQIKSIREWLSDNMMSLEDVYDCIRKGSTPIYTPPVAKASHSNLTLTALNTPAPLSFKIGTQDFLIGRSEDDVDGYVSFNQAVGRVHCKVINENGSYKVVDLESKNGTFINKAKIQPNKKMDLNNGDILRLANCDFKVSIS